MAKCLKKIRFIFNEQRLTHFAGLALFQQFCKSIGLNRFLSRHIDWPKKSHGYDSLQVFLAHILAIVAGIGRVENSQALKYNGTFPWLMGFDSFPSISVMRSFLVSFDDQYLMSLRLGHDRCRKQFFDRFRHYSAIIDIDTTSVPVFGKQERAFKGYVPHYANQRCYNIRLATDAVSGMTLATEFRPGNASGMDKIVPFAKDAFSKLPTIIAKSRTRVRADAGFYDGNLIQYIDEQGAEYVIVARITGRMRSHLETARFTRFKPGYECAEFQYQPHGWKSSARFIAIRRTLSTMEPPVTLFSLKDYEYQVLVTNLTLQPENIWRFYCDRVGPELIIRTLKEHFNLTKIPSRSFVANRVYAEIISWAYDLVAWFKQSCLPDQCQTWKLSTLRRDLWVVPGYLVHYGNQNVLRMPRQFPNKELFVYAQNRLNILEPLN